MKAETRHDVETLRHSTAHVMAAAVLELFPGAKLGIGPAIENGFYYDFDLPCPLTLADLDVIEARMREIIGSNFPFSRLEISMEEAIRYMEEQGQNYKVELLRDLQQGTKPGSTPPGAGSTPPDKVSFYKLGDIFVDLCKGPHLESAGQISAFKLTSLAGAYWRGDEKKPMLQRIYGAAFHSQAELGKYLKLLEEAKERDHRIIGKAMQLFAFSPWTGKGLPLLLPNGAVLRRELERFIVDEEIRRGYQHVYTPSMAPVSTYETSGHWPHYQEFMYPIMEIDDNAYVLRPMTCPHHFAIYATQPRTYRELPMRIAEIASMHRYERSGELLGLSRVRIMNLNDAHIFVTPEQLEEEFVRVLDLIKYVYRLFGLQDFWYRLSLHDPANKTKYLHNEEMWESAESKLRGILKAQGEKFEEKVGEAAHYGPKLDVQVGTATGNYETLSTIQIDFFLPDKFELEYIDKDQSKKRPVVIHRGIISTMERMMAFLIEHYKGRFPVWLSPVQAVVIPITDEQLEYAYNLAQRLRDNCIRVEVDDRSERMNAKIRDAQMQNVPYMLIVGKREVANNMVSVRLCTEKVLGSVSVDSFISMVLCLIRNRSPELVAEEFLGSLTNSH